MAIGRLNEHSLRPTENLLVWAFLISLVAHGIFYGGYLIGKHQGWWQVKPNAAWLKKAQLAMAEAQKKAQANAAREVEQRINLEFVQVDPSQAAKEAPKDAKYYSAVNAAAANKDVDLESNVPKIDGKQKDMPKTQTSKEVKPFPLQPKATPDKGEESQPQEAKPKGGPKPGDLAIAKPAEKTGEGKLADGKGTAETPINKRPRTLAEAGKPAQLPGEAMQQKGGVKRRTAMPSLDVKGTPFGAYDEALVRAISLRWHTLLDEERVTLDQAGKVVIEFRLNYDGRISDMKLVRNDVGTLHGYLCQRAITDPAPYEKWPADMRRIIGADYREITFTFNIY